MSIESINSTELFWRCKWLQMAEDGEEANSPVQRGNDANDVHEEYHLHFYLLFSQSRKPILQALEHNLST